MQHEDGLCKARNIDNPERSGRITNTDFSHARTNARHRFPVIRLVTALDAFKLEAGIATWPLRKLTQAIQRISKKNDLFHCLYQNRYSQSIGVAARQYYFAKILRTRSATAGGVA